MKKYLKPMVVLLAVVLTVTLVACFSSNENDTTLYRIGICQLVQHDAHDAATQGFIDALNDELPGLVSFNTQNAANEIPLCTTIVNQFIAEDVDLILANATPALQAASAATDDIPILGTSVTEYSVIMGLNDFDGLVGGNVSGTSDLAPTAAQADMVKTWFPEANEIGLLYCSAESNSQYQVGVMRVALENLGYTCTFYPFTDTNDLPAVLEGAIANCDVLYVPTDNTVASSAAIIDNYCRPAGIPIIGGDKGICNDCTVATLSVDYYDLGYKTGLMAKKVLTGDANISELPIEYAEYTPVYNPDLCSYYGITPADGYTAIAD